MSSFPIAIAQTILEPVNEGSIDPKAILQLHREMKVVYGWKMDYGKLTSTDDGKRKRAIAEAQADRFMRNCCVAFRGNLDEFDKMMAEFKKLREDFGWKKDYGKLTTTAKAAGKREEAEIKAEEALAKMVF